MVLHRGSSTWLHLFLPVRPTDRRNFLSRVDLPQFPSLRTFPLRPPLALDPFLLSFSTDVMLPDWSNYSANFFPVTKPKLSPFGGDSAHLRLLSSSACMASSQVDFACFFPPAPFPFKQNMTPHLPERIKLRFKGSRFFLTFLPLLPNHTRWIPFPFRIAGSIFLLHHSGL